MKNRMGLPLMPSLHLRIQIRMRKRVTETIVLLKIKTLKNIIIMARGMRRREMQQISCDHQLKNERSLTCFTNLRMIQKKWAHSQCSLINHLQMQHLKLQQLSQIIALQFMRLLRLLKSRNNLSMSQCFPWILRMKISRRKSLALTRSFSFLSKAAI